MDYFRNVSLDNKVALEWVLSVYSGSSLYLKNMMEQALSRAIVFFSLFFEPVCNQSDPTELFIL